MKNEQILFELEDSFGDWFNGKFEAPQMTNKLYPYTHLFSPIKINKLTVKNRIVMGPMGNISMAEETGRPNQKMISYLTERAKGGAGLITTGLIPVSFGIDSSIKELGNLTYFPRIDRSRTVMSGWRDLAEEVHAHGANIFVQLTAGIGRVGNPQCLITQLKLPVSASWNPNFYIPQIPCKRLSDCKIKKIVKNFGQASADAKACTLDGVYLHGHEGYLMEQLTNTAFNRRKLGRYSNWQKFGLDVVSEIRKRVGPNFPIMYRIDLSLALNSTYKEKMDTTKPLKKFKYERTIDQTLKYMANLVKAGVDMFDVDLGCYDNWWLPHPPASMPSGCFLDIAKMAKDYFEKNNILSNAGVPVPVVAVGKLGYPDLAEKALRDNKCDMIMLARPLLADPEWPNKAYAGKTQDILPCIGCHEGCIREFVEGGHPQCAVNPRTAFEEIFAKQIIPAKTKKKIAVVGAGPAGVVAAANLIARGHSVELIEKTNKIGGALVAAAVPKIKYEVKNYVDFLNQKIAVLKKNPNFKLSLNKEATAKSLKAQKFDCIVVATGSVMTKFKTPGMEQEHVVTVIDALKNPKLVKNAKHIVIVGGGDSGCETAYWLKYEFDKDVTIVELTPNLMANACTANRGHIIHYLEKAGVKVHNLSTIDFVGFDTVRISKNVHPSVPTPFNTWQPILPENIKNPLAPKIKTKIEKIEIPADLVILAAGNKANDEIYYELVKTNAAAEIYNIGDSFKPGKVFSATKSAYRKTLDI